MFMGDPIDRMERFGRGDLCSWSDEKRVITRLSPIPRIRLNAAVAAECHLIRPDGARAAKSRVPPINCFHYTFSPGDWSHVAGAGKVACGVGRGRWLCGRGARRARGARAIKTTSIAQENIHKHAMLQAIRDRSV